MRQGKIHHPPYSVNEHLPGAESALPLNHVGENRAERLFMIFWDLQTAAQKCFSIHLVNFEKSSPPSAEIQTISPRGSSLSLSDDKLLKDRKGSGTIWHQTPHPMSVLSMAGTERMRGQWPTEEAWEMSSPLVVLSDCLKVPGWLNWLR